MKKFVVSRGVPASLFLWRPPILPPSLFFSKFVQLPRPSSLSPPTPFPTALSLAEWVHHIWYAISLNDNMDQHILSLGSLVPERPWCAFCATRCQVNWVLIHNVDFCWYSNLIAHSGANRLTHPYDSQQLSLLHWMGNSLI